MRSGCRGGRERRGHVFLCRACRVQALIASAWRRLPPPAASEVMEPVPEDFVRRVSTILARDHRRRRRRRAFLTASAALLFFFLAGAARESASGDAKRPEETYSQLLTPSPLESLLPE